MAVGSVQFERLTVDGKGDFSEINISGDAVTIGSPGSGGHVRTSRLNVPAELEVDATGDVNLQEFKVRTGRVLVDTAGTMVNVTGSSFSLAKKPGAAPPEVVVTAGAGSTCDLSETTVTNMTLVVSCDTVVGP